MNFSIQSAKTIDEAVEKALLELKATRDEVDIEVIEEPSGGFLGLIGGKDAIVKVKKKMDHKDIVESILKDEEIQSVRTVLEEKAQEEAAMIEDDESEAPSDEADEGEAASEEALDFDYLDDEAMEEMIREYIDRIMGAMELAYTLSVDFRENEIDVSIDGKKEETGIVIGKHGSTLNGIQIVLSAMVNQRSEEFRRVIVDCSGYRKKREQVLKRIAGKTANKVLKTNKSIKLEPMNAQERRIIHACLANVDGIRTRSEGKDPHRRVVIHKDTSQPS
ncbi:Jag N-terminal domain-containing protein [Peptoniphilus sp. EMRHCC_23]|uniref:RNA-binding cell elongation regulator Jag/EloR n=1 Tax=Peptoniphilus rachelemmaiella TaxID=2811779 RepID=UPI001BFFF7FE|nr:RNA-binding cell elongation regulator Jag/EloR [Peptoniphilus rachelemmaiella]